MTTLGSLDFLADEQIRPFVRDQRADLLASDTETIAAGQYVVYKHRVKKGQVEIVKAIVPYAMRRINVGSADERFESILPAEGNGYFAFSPIVNNQPLFIADVDYNAPRLASGTLTNTDRQKRSGITTISLNPWAEAQNNPPTHFAAKVNSDTELVVTFEILPAATTSPLTSGTYTISASAAVGRRVDFAGCVVAGIQMPESVFNALVRPPSAAGPSSQICR